MGDWVGSVPVIRGALADKLLMPKSDLPWLRPRRHISEWESAPGDAGRIQIALRTDGLLHTVVGPDPTLIPQVGIAGVDRLFRNPVGIPGQHVIVRAGR